MSRTRSPRKAAQFRAMLVWAGDACLCCRRPFYYGKVQSDGGILGADLPQRDHVVARSKGGGDSIENIQPLCRKCNVSKGVRTIDYRHPSWRAAVLGLGAP